MQRRAARWICSKWIKSSFCWDKSFEFNDLKVELRRDMLTICQVYNNHLDCLFFSNTCTRSHNLAIQCNLSRINAFRYSFFIHSIFLWNLLSLDTVNTKSLISFKHKLLLNYKIVSFFFCFVVVCHFCLVSGVLYNRISYYITLSFWN